MEYLYDLFLNQKNNQDIYRCCRKMNICKDEGIWVCEYCGQIKDYDYVNEYKDEVRIKRFRKSKYYRNTYLRNYFIDTIQVNYVKLPRDVFNNFFQLLKMVEINFRKLYPERKRFFKVNYVFYQILLYLNRKERKLFKYRISKKLKNKYNIMWEKIFLT